MDIFGYSKKVGGGGAGDRWSNILIRGAQLLAHGPDLAPGAVSSDSKRNP